MKKIILSFVTLLAMCNIFVACGSDDDSGMTFTTTPEEQAVGTYTGTFVCDYTDLDGVEHHDVAEGTMQFGANSPYVSDITFTCANLELATSSVANISHANADLIYYNNNVANGFGGRFTGRIFESGMISMTAVNTKTVMVKVTRKGEVIEIPKDITSKWTCTGNKVQSNTTE